MHNDNNINNNINNTSKSTLTTNLKGGKVIGSGGFGCVFNPAIKCKGQKRGNKTVTKLMKKKYVKTEFNGIQKYKEMLKGIPNYSDYFLVDGFSTCEPDKLDEEDLTLFDKKCSALKKMKITSKNVNDSLNKLMALNMPYGGIDLGDYVDESKMDYKKLIKMNESLIKLLKNGIFPMNEKNIYHCDVKDANILILEDSEASNNIKARLVDWGLSVIFKERNSIPKLLTNRPFQYNVPFSIILFNDTFTKMHAEFLKKEKDPTYFDTRSFVINYVITWINKRGAGHLKTLNSCFKTFFERGLINVEEQFKKDIIEFEYTFYFIFEYISYVLFKFTKDGKFDKMGYFSQVFLKNIDIWGFVMSYLPILEYLEEYYEELSSCEIDIVKKIINMVLYVIECSYVPIDIDKLLIKIDELNALLLKAQSVSTIKFKAPADSSSNSGSNNKTSSKSHTHSRSRSKSTSSSTSISLSKSSSLKKTHKRKSISSLNRTRSIK
jgi:hypothetical protein